MASGHPQHDQHPRAAGMQAGWAHQERQLLLRLQQLPSHRHSAPNNLQNMGGGGRAGQVGGQARAAGKQAAGAVHATPQLANAPQLMLPGRG